jgi:hypothetical protein
MMSGRKSAHASESWAISSRARSGSVPRPRMIWTKPASNRARAMNRPSSVTPAVDPSHPIAPGASSAAHRSIAARTAAASSTCPRITWTNTAPPFVDVPACAGAYPGPPANTSAQAAELDIGLSPT